MQFTTTATYLFTILAVALMSAAKPIQLVARDVYTPPVTYPHAGTVWKVGNYHNVTWDNSDPPQRVTNPIGQIILRKNNATIGNQIGITLASGFSIVSESRVVVQVPDVAPGSDYYINLFGDSGDTSPLFTITN
ncbi:hypothetical protein BC834DRAFT_667990 [Gloeopeniophorella convolvens]|nr:hypothetical protein BC834DRAFT_667990 [Gloeopeniophorella convolvens]